MAADIERTQTCMAPADLSCTAQGNLVMVGDDVLEPVASTQTPFWAQNSKIAPVDWQVSNYWA